MDELTYSRYMADLAYFITLQEQNPDSKYFMPIALAYNKMEKYDESISVCKAAIERFPSYCQVKTLLAEAYIYKGEVEDAKQLLFDIIMEDPENYKALKLMGMVYKSSDETGEALKYYKAAYIRAPEDEDLKRTIEEMGGSVSPDDLFEEYVKKNRNSLLSNTDEKQYKDIEQNIRSAEVMMSDLVSDTKISENLSKEDPKAPGNIPADINLLTDDEISKLLTGAGSGDSVHTETSVQNLNENNQEEPDKNVSQSIDKQVPDNVLSTDNKISKIAVAEPTTQEVGTEELSDNLITNMDNKEDYSDLNDILEPGDGDHPFKDDMDMEASDVLAALDSSDDEPTDKNINPIQHNPQTENKFSDEGEDDEFFVLDEDDLSRQQGFLDEDVSNIKDKEKSSELMKNHEDEVINEVPKETDKKNSGETVYDIADDKNSETQNNDVTIVKQSKDQFKENSEVSPKENKSNDYPLNKEESSLEYKIDDIMGDDKEDDRPIAEEDIPAKELGESSPFTQQDIMEEILAASGINNSKEEKENIPSQETNVVKNVNSSNSTKEKKLQKLLKFQAQLEKLKKVN